MDGPRLAERVHEVLALHHPGVGDDEPDILGFEGDELAKGLVDLVGGTIGTGDEEDGRIAEQGRRPGIANGRAAILAARDHGHLLGIGLLGADRRDGVAHRGVDERTLGTEGDRDASRSR